MDLAAILRCVDCKGEMQAQGASWRCKECGRVYERLNSVIMAHPGEMGDFEKAEAEYHDSMHDDPLEVHQLCAWRNVFYHNMVIDFVRTNAASGLLLEIGAGIGFDAASLKSSSYEIILTDISPLTLDRASKLGTDGVTYIASDGRNIPFRSEVFDGAYMIATLHHFKNPKDVIQEVGRLLKPGGYLIVGIEPNKLHFKYINKFRTSLCHMTHSKENEGSIADAEMTGFTYSDWEEFFHSEKWENIQIRPMWLLAGWTHYVLEFFYRAFKLSERVTLPRWLEIFIVNSDERLFHFAFFRHICWHWIASAKKSK